MRNLSSRLKGKVQTVSGPISPNEMGITLSHEHVLMDLTCLLDEPKDKEKRKSAYEPLTSENAGYFRYHMLENRDNLLLLDEKQAIRELSAFKHAGGRTVVDATPCSDIGRDPLGVKHVSEATGLHTIMGSGYYLKISQRLEVMNQRSEEDIAHEFIENMINGIEKTGVRSGLIGEIGVSWPLDDCEKKVLRAACLAQKETGAPLVIHPGRSEESPFEIIEIAKQTGADLNHTAMIHMERTIFDPKKRYELAELGCYLEFDSFGFEGYWPDPPIELPNDFQRIRQIQDLFARGFGDRILISHDLWSKCRYRCFGGHGYSHILDNAVPAMLSLGMNEGEIDALLIENPRKFFAFW